MPARKRLTRRLRGVILACLTLPMLVLPVPAGSALYMERLPNGQMRLRNVPDPPPTGRYGCHALMPLRNDPGEVLIMANSFEEANGYATHQLGDSPMKCRELKEGQQVSTIKPSNPLEGPFTRMTMGEYFNAIYNGEPEVVHALDQKYLGNLINTLKGGFGNNPIWQKMIAAMQVDNATLVVPAIKAYTQSYGNRYQQCLRKDAVPVSFTETITDSYGVVSSNNFVYRVNPEFVNALKLTTQGQESNGWDAMGDMGYGSPLARTEAGINEIMGTFRCNDPVIKQFEQHLLQMHAASMAQR